MIAFGLALIAIAAAHVAYTFAGYPAILWLLARVRRPNCTRRATRPGATVPVVTVTVPVYNEARQIAELLDNLLALDHPRDRLQILVISDASDDDTDDIVRSYADRGVELLRMPVRRGKTAAENAARARVRGDIIVNTDASIRLHPGAIRALVVAFDDPTIGVASGRDVSVARVGGGSNEGEARYVGYEMWVRSLETRVHGIVGASGCLFAMRRELHAHPTPEALARDFDSALIAETHGMRAVSVPDAICHVPRTGSARREYQRKVRTVTRGLATLLARRRLLDPFKHGIFAWMLLSHKLCRWLVPWALILGVAGAVILAFAWLPPWAVVAAIAATAAGAWVAWRRLDNTSLPKPLSFAAYFLAANVATIHAWLRVARGRTEPIWEPTRREPAGAGAAAPRSA
ncbi:MAG TPA: glycosyltransferase [Longimicrobiales bacterium]|nr:glycosyltransferase [Longimicrobiales bacterium]